MRGGRRGDLFYNEPAWRRVAKAFLRAHPRCAWCGAPADVVDHVIARPRGAPFDPTGHDAESNLAPMCKRCHGRKSAAFDGVFGNPKRAYTGPLGAKAERR